MSRKSILLVDDDHFFRAHVCLLLKSAGFKALEARTARDATDMLAERKPALVIVDYRMPGTDGISWVQQMRENGITIPMVLLSGSGMDQRNINKLRGLLGVQLILRKPIDPLTFIPQLESIIANSETATVKPDDSQRADASTEPLGEVDYYELADDVESFASFADTCESDEMDAVAAAMEQIRSSYLENIRFEIVRIEELVSNWSTAPSITDVHEVASITHKIRGSAGSYGLDTAGVVAGQIEDLVNKISDESQLSVRFLENSNYHLVKLKSAVLYGSDVGALIGTSKNENVHLLEGPANSPLRICMDKDVSEGGDEIASLDSLDNTSDCGIGSCESSFDSHSALAPVSEIVDTLAAINRVAVSASERLETFPMRSECPGCAERTGKFGRAINALSLGRVTLPGGNMPVALTLKTTKSITKAVECVKRDETELVLIDANLYGSIDLEPLTSATRQLHEVGIPFAMLGDSAATIPTAERIYFGDCAASNESSEEQVQNLIAEIGASVYEKPLYSMPANGYRILDREAFMSWLSNFEPTMSGFSVAIIRIEETELNGFVSGVSVHDELVKLAEKLLTKCFRYIDVRCKWSDNKFAVAFPGLDASTARDAVELFKQEFQRAIVIRQKREPVKPKVKIGVSQSEMIIDIDRLLEFAFKDLTLDSRVLQVASAQSKRAI